MYKVDLTNGTSFNRLNTHYIFIAIEISDVKKRFF